MKLAHLYRLYLQRLALTLLVVCVLVSPAIAEVRFVGATGATWYARIERSDHTFFAVQLPEDTGNTGGDGNYVVDDAAVLSAAGDTLAAGNYTVTYRPGTASASAADTPADTKVLHWNGTRELTDAEVNSPGSFTETERAQVLAALSIGEEIGVPSALTWVIERKDGQMKANAVAVKDAEEEADAAADFRKVLAPGDALDPTTPILSIQLLTTGSGLIDSPAFDDVNEAEVWMASAIRFHLTGGTAGTTYSMRVKVLTVGGQKPSAIVQMKVTGS